MLDRFKNIFPRRDEGVRLTPLAPLPSVTAGQFSELVKLFPIGARVKYCPKGQSDLLFDTLLIGYRINGIDVYSSADFHIEKTEHGSLQLLLDKASEAGALQVIDSLAFLAPSDSHDVERLDYARREELEQIGHAEAGSLLTLLGQSVGRQTPSIECRLEQTQRLQDGVYANQHVYVFSLDIERLTFYDQRSFYRIETCYPAELQPATGGNLIACDIRDFSEMAAKIELISEVDVPENLWEGRRVILGMQLDNRPVHLQGRVLRREANGHLVVRFESIQEGDDFIPLSNLEALSIKSQLLQASVKERR